MQTAAAASSVASTCMLHFRLPARPLTKLHRRQPLVSASTKQDGYSGGGGGGLVDENMIVLRKMIHETKMAERNYEPPFEWMEWEKQYYTSYNSDICELLGVVQTLVMNTRPSVAIGLLVLCPPQRAHLTILRHFSSPASFALPYAI